jgi:hypothetical protein
MFKQALTNLPLADCDASDFFTSINADLYEGDETFRATLRMLLHSRTQQGESINVKVFTDSKNARHVEGLDIRVENDSLVIKNPLNRETLYVVVLKGYSDERLQQIEGSAKGLLSAYHFHAKASLYLSQNKCKTSVYINEPEHRTVVLVRNMTQVVWHKMQSSICKLIPWFFTSPLTVTENDLLKSLTVQDSGRYLELITAFAKTFNYHEDKISRLLNGFGLKHERQRLENFNHERSRNHDKFESLQREIATCIAKERDLQISITGIETLLEQGDGSGLTDYFICNKSIHLQTVGTDNLTFMVTTYLDYFDQIVFDRVHANPNSYFYDKTNGLARDEESFKKLLLALYGDESCIRVRVCAEFELSLSGTLRPVRSSSRTANFPHWLPHPHIDGAACLGSNSTQINRLMMERKYLEAIEQAVSATKNINFADSAIAPKLIQAIRTGTQKFLELPNGEVVTPGMAIKWLNPKEGDESYSA